MFYTLISHYIIALLHPKADPYEQISFFFPVMLDERFDFQRFLVVGQFDLMCPTSIYIFFLFSVDTMVFRNPCKGTTKFRQHFFFFIPQMFASQTQVLMVLLLVAGAIQVAEAQMIPGFVCGILKFLGGIFLGK